MKPQNLFARILTAAFCCILIFCSACKKQDGEPSLSSAQILTLIRDSQGYSNINMTVLVSPGESFYRYIESCFGISKADIKDGAVIRVDDTPGEELFVLQLSNKTKADSAKKLMEDYVNSRIGVFFGYAPETVFMLENNVISVRENYIALFICESPDKAETAFIKAFNSDISKITAIKEQSDSLEKHPEEDIGLSEFEFNHNAILTEWKTGEKQGLSQKNQAILDICRDVIDEIITDGMSDYEKELAIHDWIIEWAAYDTAVFEGPSHEDSDSDSSNPYGLLVNKLAICSGYTEIRRASCRERV